MQTVINKRILYISLFLLLTASFGSRAQEYIPMLKEGNQWNVILIGSCPDDHNDWTYNTSTYQLKDTVLIDDVEYITLLKTFDALAANKRVVGYLREDIETQKVYFRGDKEHEEGVIYDYDVEVGDSMQTIIPSAYKEAHWFRSLNVITAIDTIEIEGRKHRQIALDAHIYRWSGAEDKWHVGGSTSVVCVEGIGSIDGLLTGFPAAWGGVEKLLAFKQNGEVVYNPYNYAKDFYWDEAPSYASIEQLGDELPIHITLSSDQLVIRNDQEAEYDIALYAPTGRLILTQRSGGREAVVNLSSLPAGVYFLRVYGERGEVTKKIRVRR
ncbi:T9SS type A sorting domain-containing protein [Parabacteroides sp. OttesenSCG-928-N08]|nr:T9SS type A sorting domain-containing protein [Parabacteroides sp. OttesenSCG-928-N08]